MNTTKHTSQQSTSIFGSLKSLGRGIAVSSAVAVMGIGTLSAADASAAGVATGVRHASTVTSTTNAATRASPNTSMTTPAAMVANSLFTRASLRGS